MTKLEILFDKSFSKYKSTFKDTSYDDKKDQYLCTDRSQVVYNFDQIVRDKYNYPYPSSPDVIMLDKNKVYLIEFKNSDNLKRIKSKIIKNKLKYGSKIISSIFNDNSGLSST